MATDGDFSHVSEHLCPRLSPYEICTSRKSVIWLVALLALALRVASKNAITDSV